MSAPESVVIVGGGLVGACLATLLARAEGFTGADIVLVEARLPEAPKAGAEIDLRVSAISRASERILTACGVWDRLEPAYCAPYERMCVWDEAGDPAGAGGIRFDCADIGEPNLGYIAENRRLQWQLLERARESGVTIANSALRSIHPLEEGSGVAIELANGQRLRASLLVAADGADSPTRTALGLSLNDATLGHAVVAHIRTELGHQSTAWQRFLSTGPIALLPLADGRCSIVWSTTGDEVKDLLALDEPAFCASVREATGSVLGNVEAASPRVGFPLRSGQVHQYAGPHWALVGDAAHSVHPLAGQGVNLGFLDAAALVEVLTQAREEGEGIGDPRVLRRYERWRKGENLAMLTALEGINDLFSNRNTLLGLARRFGLSAVDRARPLKHFFMRRALGLQGDSPRWVRSERVPHGGH